jgi:hypothetical protein
MAGFIPAMTKNGLVPYLSSAQRAFLVPSQSSTLRNALVRDAWTVAAWRELPWARR